MNELLLQSRNGYVEIFPAVPSTWKDCSFKNLRTEGAFLVTASYKDGKTRTIEILAEKGGPFNVKLPKGTFKWLGKNLKIKDNRVKINTVTGQRLVFVNAD